MSFWVYANLLYFFIVCFFSSDWSVSFNSYLKYYVSVVHFLFGLYYSRREGFINRLSISILLKRRFLQPEIFVDANGEAHEIGWSTSRLTTSQMMDYIAQVQQFAVEFLNVIIPDPGEQAQLWTESE